MTPEEALAAVRKAVELLPENDADDLFAWPHTYEEIEIVLAALCALSPDGPLVAVPRETMKHLAQVYCDARCPSVWKTSRGRPHTKGCQELRAMIEEASKQ